MIAPTLLWYNAPTISQNAILELPKQGLRRKLGTKSLARYVRCAPEELLVDNLNDPDYLEMVCSSSWKTSPTHLPQTGQRTEDSNTTESKDEQPPYAQEKMPA